MSYMNERFEVEVFFYVGVDGVVSMVVKNIGVLMKVEFLIGYEIEVVGEFERIDFIEVWVNKEIMFKFFVWVIFVEDDLVRVGIFGILDELNRFLRVRMFKFIFFIEFKVGSVGFGWRKLWIRENVVFIGDVVF